MKRIFPILLLSAFLFSCQADTEDLVDPNPDPTTNDSIYVKTLVELDTGFAPGIDTSAKLMFTYDDKKRVSRVIFTYYEPGKAGPQGFWYDHKWDYNGNDTLPALIALAWGDYNSPDPYRRDSSFLTYTDKMITKDSTMSTSENDNWRHVRVMSLTNLSGNKQLITLSEGDLPRPGYVTYPPDTSYFQVQTTWSNGNLVFKRDSSYRDAYVSESLRTFDDHPNPLRRVSLPGVINPLGDPFLWRYFTNNVTSINTNGTSGPDPDQTLEYRYRADGYPLSYKRQGTTLKVIFVYTKP